jgi:hypothetical protein
MFKNSLPKLINTPEGNEVISNTLAGLAQYKLDRAAIAEKALTREITPADALKQMRELPNPIRTSRTSPRPASRLIQTTRPQQQRRPQRRPTTSAKCP